MAWATMSARSAMKRNLETNASTTKGDTAMLHDIGKIGVPREIINKPSRLTDEEYEIIKTHPIIGSKTLEGITELMLL